MKLKLLCLSAWFLFNSIVFTAGPRPVFGLKISLNPSPELYQIYIFIDNGRTLTQKRSLNTAEFVKFASGYWPSVYNPKRRNLFEENNIDNCGIYEDKSILEVKPYCFRLDSLWKIHWMDYPYRGGNEMGWANNAGFPSLKQQKYLYDNYGVANIDLNLFIDTNFWKILRDVQDSTWVRNYQSLK